MRWLFTVHLLYYDPTIHSERNQSGWQTCFQPDVCLNNEQECTNQLLNHPSSDSVDTHCE